MSYWSKAPTELRRGLREQEDRARDMGLVSVHTPRAEDDDYDRYIIFTPTIYEDTERGSQRYDLYSRLLKDRIIFLGRDIDDRVANLVTAQLLFLETQDPDKDVNFYINSPGGVITSGLGIYDTMELIRCDVQTVCIGQAASMGAVLLCTGAKGKRASLPHSRIMIHQPLGGMRGQAADLMIHYKETIELRDRLYHIMAGACGRTYDELLAACDRDNFMDPVQAKEFGLIDTVIERQPGVTNPVG